MKAAFPPADPVEQDADGKWWFWDETWADKYGPYETKEAVHKALWTYCVYELGISREVMEPYEPVRQD
jgi:hypothetical protein